MACRGVLGGAALGHHGVVAGDQPMTEHTIRMPGGCWMTRKAVLDYLGLPEAGSSYRKLKVNRKLASLTAEPHSSVLCLCG